MNKQEAQYIQLLQQYSKGTITDDGRKLLMQALAKGKVADSAIEASIAEAWNVKLKMDTDTDVMAAGKKEALYQKIKAAIWVPQEASAPEVPSVAISNKRPVVLTWLAAASIVGLLLFAGLWITGVFSTQSQLAKLVPTDYKKITNTQNSLQVHGLPDGSTVQLMAGASLYYPEQFTTADRLVYLEGDAFFKVEKLNGSTFKVLSTNLITEVLGTSFWVREQGENNAAKVEVRTGKVKVSANHLLQNNQNEQAPMVVMPNQQVQMINADGTLQILLADTLLPLILPETSSKITVATPSFQYQQPTRLKKILAEIEKVYGVHIAVENPSTFNCLMAGDLSAEELLRKLDIICLSIGAAYRIDGTNIIITGKGCS